MADIDLYQNDCEDSQDDDYGPAGSWMDTGDDSGLGGDDPEACNPDDLLTPLQKMEKYMESENIFSRQMVARSLMETLTAVGNNPQEATTVLANMVRLAEDSGTTPWESTLRADLMDQVAHLALYCQQNKHLVPNAVPAYILPIITRYLVDQHTQVRKTSQAALLVLLEHELVDRGDLEEQVCPVILDLSSAESIDDFRTEAVALMSKMAPLVGRDITERIFLPRFCEMCTDALFHVRKVCAANFGEMCTVVGQDNVQKYLLSKFMFLCEDGVWGVRKACAECFMEVSCACSIDVRKNELAALFVNLISDSSRWVRMSAFQALGGFISTFADPSITGLYYNDEGVLMAGNPRDFAMKLAEDDHPDAEKLLTELDRLNQEGEAAREAALLHDLDSVEVPSDVEHEPMRLEIEELNHPTAQPQESMAEEPQESLLEEPQEALPKEPQGALLEKPEETESVGNTSPPEDICGSRKENSVGNVDQCSSQSRSNNNNQCDNNVDSVKESPACDSEDASAAMDNHSSSTSSGEVATGTSQPIHVHLRTEEYNNFQFWRMPLPEVDVDLELVDGEPRAIKITTRLHEGDNNVRTKEISVAVPPSSSSQVADVTGSLKEVSLQGHDSPPEQGGSPEQEDSDDELMMHTASVSTVNDETETVTHIGSTHVLGQHLEESNMSIINGIVQDLDLSFGPKDSSLSLSSQDPLQDEFYAQDVIPQALLDHYLSMSDPSRAQSVDAEIARHCAYSLPAVAYTLGRRFWPCLKDLYETLATDMQWKVRRTLAFSIHELAVIVGEDITAQDLVPIFNGFLKDLDEVRVGVLKHLADFLALLTPETRVDYLTRIPEFLETDNNRNWRFREELAAQLLLLNDLFKPEDISEHLLPVALALAEDKVAEVRLVAFRVLGGMLRRISQGSRGVLVSTFVNDVINRFSVSSKWSKRQIFAQVCQHILEAGALPPSQFATMLLPSLLVLSSDPIPNVRICLAKAMAGQVTNSDYFTGPQNPHHEDLLSTIKRLQSDSDRDVRFFICGDPYSSWLPSEVIPV